MPVWNIKIKSKNELKEIDIKNQAYYYFDDKTNSTDPHLSDIIFSKTLSEFISVYQISYKTSTGPKQLRIRFNKINGFVFNILDGKIRHLILFGYGLLSEICDKIKYLISKKSVITNCINHNFGRIKFDSYNSLPTKKILIFHNVIILIKSVVNKNKNKCYCNIFLEKGSYKDKWIFVYYIWLISIELTFLKELMSIKQVHQKSVIFVTICIS